MLDQQCCPCYTIKQNSLEFSTSKSQKKVIKNFNKFVNIGEISKSGEDLNETQKQKPLGEKKSKVIPKPGTGPDPTKPPCKKSKERRREEIQAKTTVSKYIHN